MAQLISAQVDVQRVFWRGLLILVLPLSFRTFQFFPGMLYVQEAWFVLSFLAVTATYLLLKIHGRLMFSWFDVYIATLIVFSVSVAAWQAHMVFEQPFLYGLLSQRQIVLLAACLVMASLLRSGSIHVHDLEAALLFLAWTTCVLFVTMRLFLSPANFAQYGEGFVTRAMVGTEPSFKLQEYFILFGVFYYALLGMRTRRILYYIAAAILFPVTLGGSGRGIAVSVAATLLLVLYRIRGFRKATLSATKFALIFTVLLAALYVIFPSAAASRSKAFSSAFTAMFTGETTQDPSANARIVETLTALPYIQLHPFLGNGIVSHQWQGGSETAMGAYFFAADIGIVGIVFSYGSLGLLLYLAQFRFAWLALKNIPNQRQSPFLDAAKAFLLYSAIYSTESGICVWSADVTLFFVAALCGLSTHTHALPSRAKWIGEPCSLQEPA
jgi:hypothetical protein